MKEVLKVLRDLRIETSERNNYSQSYAFGYTDAISDAIQAVKKLTLTDVVGTCCDETRKINQFLQRPSKYCMTCSKEMK